MLKNSDFRDPGWISEAYEHADVEDGHHAAVRQFLQRCYPMVLKFQREPDEFERVKADRFWEASRQRPKDADAKDNLKLFRPRNYPILRGSAVLLQHPFGSIKRDVLRRLGPSLGAAGRTSCGEHTRR
jgi:hypothetical protein